MPELLIALHYGALLVLLVQVHDIEFAQIEVQVVQGLKDGNAALKKMNQVWNVVSSYNVKLFEETSFAGFCS